VDFVAADMPSVNRLTAHVLAAVAEHEREMASQRTKAALAAARCAARGSATHGCRRAGTLAAVPYPVTPGGVARAEAATVRAFAAYGPVVAATRAAGGRSLGDYAQAAHLPATQGGVRWSRPSVARVLRYCGTAANAFREEAAPEPT